MAEKKLAVIAEVLVDSGNHLEVWADDSEPMRGIEGVVLVRPRFSDPPLPNCWLVVVDPRYDMEEVRQEILAKFQPSIHDVFTEEER